MKSLKVGIMGYGVIGKRLADAIVKQKDMNLIGIVKKTDNYGMEIAKLKDYRVYSLDGSFGDGCVEDLLKGVDVIVDVTPGGIGAKNLEKYYEKYGLPAVFQGGESADIGKSFNALANYDDVRGKKYVRVVSCNTTGISRLLSVLNQRFGVEEVYAVLMRRGADPNEDKKGPINSIIPAKGLSHHADDVKEVMPLSIRTKAYKVPTTLMHLHDLEITLKQAPTYADVLNALQKEPRIAVVDYESGINSTAKIMDYAREFRERGDLYENIVFNDFEVVENKLYLTQAIHQEAIIIPEIIDALRAMQGVDKYVSMKLTNESLNIGDVFN